MSARSFLCCQQHLRQIVWKEWTKWTNSFEPCDRDGRLRWICCCEGAPHRASQRKRLRTTSWCPTFPYVLSGISGILQCKLSKWLMICSAKGKQKKSKEEEQMGILEVLSKHFNLKNVHCMAPHLVIAQLALQWLWQNPLAHTCSLMLHHFAKSKPIYQATGWSHRKWEQKLQPNQLWIEQSPE